MIWRSMTFTETYKVLVMPDHALQKDRWILLDLKMILLEC